MNGKKKKIIFVLPGALLGGIERHLARQLRHFDRKKYSFTVFVLFKGKRKEDLFPEDVPVYECGITSLKDWRGISRIRALLREIDPDIVVSSVFDANAICSFLSLFYRFVCIPREHNLYPEKPLRIRIVDHLISYIVPTIVTNSEWAADAAAKQAWIPRKKFTVIQNGIDLEEISRCIDGVESRGSVRDELGMKEGEKIILSVARLQPQKNHRLMLDAFALFARKNKLHQLVLVGDGELRNQLPEYAGKLGIADRVKFVGKRDSLPFYAFADFFLLTSKKEGFPNVVLESCAFGVPVVSVPLPGVVEIIKDGETGCIAENTPEALAMCIDKMTLLSDTERVAYGDRCREVVTHYTIEKNVERYEALFNRVSA